MQVFIKLFAQRADRLPARPPARPVGASPFPSLPFTSLPFPLPSLLSPEVGYFILFLGAEGDNLTREEFKFI